MIAAANSLRRLCVFCGSSRGANPAYFAAAEAAGRELASRGIELVYGGGRAGLMGAMADAALAAGGHVIGVIPESLVAREVGHVRLPDLRVVKSMHERKALMAELADGFIALPGGLGTFEEFFEIVTWAQLGLHAKPCGLLNVANYFSPMLDLLDRAVRDGFMREGNRSLIRVDAEIRTLLDGMANHRVQPQDPLVMRELR